LKERKRTRRWRCAGGVEGVGQLKGGKEGGEGRKSERWKRRKRRWWCEVAFGDGEQEAVADEIAIYVVIDGRASASPGDVLAA
jgi:hypothetical protein